MCEKNPAVGLTVPSNLLIFSALLLNSIISAFKPEFVAVRAVQFTDMIKECEDTGFPKVKSLSSDQISSFF